MYILSPFLKESVNIFLSCFHIPLLLLKSLLDNILLGQSFNELSAPSFESIVPGIQCDRVYILNF